MVSGGAVDFRDVSFEGLNVSLFGGRPTLSDTSIDAYLEVREGASPTIEDSEIMGHASVDGPGRTIIRRSTLHDGTSASWDAIGAYDGNHFIGMPLEVDTGSDMLVKGNLIEGVQQLAGILVVGHGSTAEIVDNTVRDSAIGIVVDSDEPGSSIMGNSISDVRIGIHVDSESPVEVVENTIDAARTSGIVLQGDGASVLDNSICGLGVAFDIRSGSPSILSNDVCDELEP